MNNNKKQNLYEIYNNRLKHLKKLVSVEVQYNNRENPTFRRATQNTKSLISYDEIYIAFI